MDPVHGAREATPVLSWINQQGGRADPVSRVFTDDPTGFFTILVKFLGVSIRPACALAGAGIWHVSLTAWQLTKH